MDSAGVCVPRDATGRSSKIANTASLTRFFETRAQDVEDMMTRNTLFRSSIADRSISYIVVAPELILRSWARERKSTLIRFSSIQESTLEPLFVSTIVLAESSR